MTKGTTLLTSVEFVASTPATYDESSFGALSYTAVGSLSSAPDNLRPSRDVQNADNLTTGAEERYAGMLRGGDGSMTFIATVGNAGQNALIAALDSGNKGSFKFTFPTRTGYTDGRVIYKTGIVQEATPSGLDGSVEMLNCTIAFDGEYVEVEPTAS